MEKASNGSGYVVQTTFSGAQGSITMVVGVDNDYKCTGISIISHSETSGLGAIAASGSSEASSSVTLSSVRTTPSPWTI